MMVDFAGWLIWSTTGTMITRGLSRQLMLYTPPGPGVKTSEKVSVPAPSPQPDVGSLARRS